MNPIIVLKNIYKYYNNVVALDNINLTIYDGEFVCIMGPSGSGKTTLLNILSLIDFPSKGEYILDGIKINFRDEKSLYYYRLKYFGFIFQRFYLIPNLTVYENIELPLIFRNINKNERKKIVDELIETLGLKGRENHLPNQLSGGQQQRVAIARALATKARIILADEPTGNLDLNSSKTVMELLKLINEKYKKTIILVTHDPNAAKYADRILVLSYGKIIKETKNVNEAMDAILR